MAATTRQRLERMLGRVVRGRINSTVFRFRGTEYEIWRFNNEPGQLPTVHVVMIGEGVAMGQKPVTTYDDLSEVCTDLVIREVMEL